MVLNVDAKNDYAFKYIFGSEQRKGILIHMLNAVLQPPPGQCVASVEIRNPLSEQVVFDDKLTILDIKARDQSGRQFNVEMQMTIPPSLSGRLLYYWAKIYGGQLTRGDEYDQLQPVISICFLDGVLFRQADQCHLHFQLREVQRQILFTDQIDFHLFQLPLFTKGAEDLQDPLEKWLYFLNNASGLDPAHLPASLQEVPINEAVRALDMLTKDELEHERYEAREKAKRDSLSWEKAIQRAQQEVQRAQQEVQRAQQEVQRAQQEAQQEAQRAQQEAQRAQQEAQRAQQEVQRAQQEAQRAQQESEQWQQRFQEGSEHWQHQEANLLIGQIQLCQHLLQQPVTPQEQLLDKSIAELRQLGENLRRKLPG